MLNELPYNREKAVQYAKTWANGRNPRYISFDGIGGDCTNFISQCIHAGGAVMNYTRDVGWYYNSAKDRAAAWSSVPYLYRFLTENDSVGPYASLADSDGVRPGDIIQLGDSSGKWYHSLLVVGRSKTDIFIATHTFDAWMRPLSSYLFFRARYLKIDGIRNW